MNVMRRFAVAVSMLAALAAAGCRRGEHATKATNAPVILISIDTLRADHLPAYGYTKVETPNIDAFRKDSILYRNAFAAVPLTFPSHTSILTGLLPPKHGVRNNLGYRLSPEIPTLPKMLKSHGYETGAAISAFVLRGELGLAQAFDFYEDGILSRPNVPIGAMQRSGDRTVAAALPWIEQRKDAPFFFMLHFFEPHSPYEAPEPFKSKYSAVPYDAEIASVDAQLGTFIERLKQLGIYDRAMVIVLSDHGEGLYEHGEPEHGIFLYREAIHVPLMVKLPKSERAGETIDTTVSLVDIAPTVLDELGLAVPAGLDGRSVLTPPKDAKSAYSETLYPRIHLGWSDLRSLVNGDDHFIQAPTPELYDMKSDPAEKQNVLSDKRRVYAKLRDELKTYGDADLKPVKVDPEEAKKLVALGYLGSTAEAPEGPLPDPKDRIGALPVITRGMKLAYEGKHEEAVVALREVLAKEPGLTDVWNQLAISLDALGRYDEAIDAYKQAVARSPKLGPAIALRIGEVLLKAERLEEAEQHAELASDMNPSGAHLLLARIAAARHEWPKAIAECTAAESDHSNRLPARVLKAQYLSEQERPAEALALVADVEQELAKQGTQPIENLEYARGDAYARLGKYPEAEAAFKREIARHPRNRLPYAKLFLVYTLMSRNAEARAALQAMYEVTPSKSTALYAASSAQAVDAAALAQYWRQKASSSR